MGPHGRALPPRVRKRSCRLRRRGASDRRRDLNFSLESAENTIYDTRNLLETGLMTPITSNSFEMLKAEIEAYPRLCGYYLIKMVKITDLRLASSNEEAMIETIFQYLDDQKWPPKEQRMKDQKWTEYIVDRETALRHTVEGLVAGPQKGHLRPTIEANIAKLFFDRFDAMFDEPKSYYIGMGLGNPAYVFFDGVVIISKAHAGLLWVVEAD